MNQILPAVAAAALALAVTAGSSPVTAAAARGPTRAHWSFEPLTRPTPPATQASAWTRNALDSFILARLEQAGLKPSPETDRLSWLRRVHFNLIGLPPSPEAVAAFLGDQKADAYERVVEGLLASPRHGERWSQHWLDVVRYADTDGFEVNTERANAWPYRDYVIRSFNENTPYDRFVREQLAGDAFGVDAATGFLVTAAALLPGQIGADDASKRLARQDALSEIVGNTGQTFLGLSVGCARCHDHKFDPIPQRDYYSVQAFFAGVHYGERPLRSPQADARREQAEALKLRVAEIDATLARFEPLAQVCSVPRRKTSARLNEETFEPREVRFVRFTIHDASLHPALGLIEPCVDEFEILTAEPTPRNVARASLGTQVTASGSRVSDSHRLDYINDGKYGNSRSWMADEAGRGWVLFELARPVRVGKVVWSRDREGNFTDRLATAYTLELGLSQQELTTVVSVPPARPAVSPQRNTERFAPVTTRRLKFIISACTANEPSLDELEVFTHGSRSHNVALARLGTKASASGGLPDRVNDGRYGSAHAWIASTEGKGWVELEFASPQQIDRVVWSCDREAAATNRLATDYRIEVQEMPGIWRLVAGSQDRRDYVPGAKPSTHVSLAGLDPKEAQQATPLLAERRSIEAKIAALSVNPVIFGGSFKTPDPTHRLHRGDPEQPREALAPAVPVSLGSIAMATNAPEQERRLTLASWIASPSNPLTARVMVNRVWQGHFGVGLVETASDFGHTGTLPSHPELLDWLATEFIRSGWSIKHLHRLITLSATFRQSSRVRSDALAMDGDTRLLWRFPARRLEAETIRDSMLAVNGRLNLKMGGPGFNLFKSRGGLDGFPPIESFAQDGLRRLIYAHKVRMERDVVFGAFDCPDAGQSTPHRRQSTSPIQALNLFNSPFTFEQAGAFAGRVRSEAGPDADVPAQVRQAWRLAFGREPGIDEAEDARAVVREHGLSTLCRALFNSNEFLFLP